MKFLWSIGSVHLLCLRNQRAPELQQFCHHGRRPVTSTQFLKDDLSSVTVSDMEVLPLQTPVLHLQWTKKKKTTKKPQILCINNRPFHFNRLIILNSLCVHADSTYAFDIVSLYASTVCECVCVWELCECVCDCVGSRIRHCTHARMCLRLASVHSYSNDIILELHETCIRQPSMTFFLKKAFYTHGK